jgi:hypothetical protein
LQHRHEQLQNHPNSARDHARKHTNEHRADVHQNSDGNLLISIPKTRAAIGIAIEGGANTKHPLPRIINIHVIQTTVLTWPYTILTACFIIFFFS